RVVFVHADDLAALGFADGDIVDIVSHWDGDEIERAVSGFRAVAYDTPRGSAAAYYPETNPLVPLDSTAAGSNTPTSKSVIVALRHTTGGSTGATGDGATAANVGADEHHKARPEPDQLS
ncbi:MAG: hypothetical protein ACRDO7_15675, partial [Nocardioidaceae bacterium]